MDTLRTDISYEWLEEKVGAEAFTALKDGDNITDAFKDDIAHPVKAVIIKVEGPGGGNPYVELTFLDEDHSWEWASENMDMDPADYEHLRRVA